MFGSTIEHVIRNYTCEYVPTGANINKDGSMHSFTKEAHPTNYKNFDTIFDQTNSSSITTTIYPFLEIGLTNIIEKRSDDFGANNRCILMFAPNKAAAELNLLFQYHKISVGLNKGHRIFYSGVDQTIPLQWNKCYTQFDDMQIWEYREWFSLFYSHWVQEWICSVTSVPDHFLKISNTHMLESPESVFQNIIEFCQLTGNAGLEKFAKKWLNAQQYILDEFALLDKIVYNTVLNQNFSWNPINVVAEAIVQHRLREQGYEIRCDGLNQFPTNSTTLHNLLNTVN